MGNSSNLLTRSQEITFTRLRLGHTRITHTYLISHLMPLSCPHCDNDLQKAGPNIWVLEDGERNLKGFRVCEAFLTSTVPSLEALSGIPSLSTCRILTINYSLNYFSENPNTYTPNTLFKSLKSISIGTPPTIPINNDNNPVERSTILEKNFAYATYTHPSIHE